MSLEEEYTFFENNRNKVLEKEDLLFLNAKTKNKEDIYLNLGCGARILDGFVNVDKYYEAPEVTNYDIFEIPYQNNVSLIFCSHVLEHLPIRHAKMALVNWYSSLKKGGKLFLSIPDLEVIIRFILDPTVESKTKEWLMYTLFGFQ